MPDKAPSEDSDEIDVATAAHPTETIASGTLPASESRGQMTIWARIKQHKIAEWTLAYVAFAFALLHGVTLLSDALEWPHVIVRSVTLLLIVGVPIVPTLAWYHGVRALKRVSGSELIIIALLLLIGGGLLWLVPRPGGERARTGTEATVANPQNKAEVSTPPAHSIAVLPFADMSEKHDQEYFADGMAEEILDQLAKIPGLTVIGRTSSFQFKGRNEDLRTIGAKLSAAHVLEGSVRKSGDHVRITTQLINTQTGAHEWSETYDRHIGDVLKLQDAIAAAVARELQLTVVSGDLQSRSTLKNADAYDLMLRGRHAADQWDREGLDSAVTLYQQALDRDATSADAAAELALAYYGQGAFGFMAPGSAFEQARRAAATALKLDPRSARAHYVLGKINIVYDWDWAAAEREFQQVAILAPGSAEALNGEARVSLALGRWDDAFRKVNAALAQDPLDSGSFQALSLIQARRGNLPQAEAAMRRLLDIRPTWTWGHFYLGLALLARDDRAAALEQMQQETSDEGREAGLAMAYYALGRKADSDAALNHMIKEHAHEYAFYIAEAYAFRRESDEVVQWLDRAYLQKDPYLCYLKPELWQKSLAADPRYKAFLKKMNLPE